MCVHVLCWPLICCVDPLHVSMCCTDPNVHVLASHACVLALLVCYMLPLVLPRYILCLLLQCHVVVCATVRLVTLGTRQRPCLLWRCLFLCTAVLVSVSAMNITAGYGHTCALLTARTVRCWGDIPAPAAHTTCSQHSTRVAIASCQLSNSAAHCNGRPRWW